MATTTWTGGSGNWIDAADWSPQGVPSTSDNVVIGAGSSVVIAPVTGAGSVSIGAASITLDGPSAVLHATTALNEYIYVPGTIAGGIFLAGSSGASHSVQIDANTFGAGLTFDVVGTASAMSATSGLPLTLAASANINVGPGGNLGLGDLAGAGAIHVASGTLGVGQTSVPIQMDDSAVRLALNAGQSATIEGFRAGDVLDFSPSAQLALSPDTHFFRPGTYQAQLTGNQLQVLYNGAVAAHVTLAGQVAPGATYTASLNSALTDLLVTTTAEPTATAAFTDQTTGASGSHAMDAASGGPSYLQWQYIDSGSDTTAITAGVPNVFLKGGSGSKALAAAAGQNVLDGGTGSAFLSGGSGTDTFFVDTRGGNATWDTLTNFHAGDALTVWGWSPGSGTERWDARDGAPSYQGATLRLANGQGSPVSSVTFAGLSAAQAAHLQMSTGIVGGLDYLSISNPGA